LSTIRLSRRVQRIQPSPTLAVTARAKELRAQGKDVIGLGAGEPDFDTPDHIKEAAIRAIHDGFTKYTAVDGTPSLKQAIVEKFKRENGLNFTADQVLVSVGGKQSFFNLALALLDEGDEVVIPAPYWVSYPDIVKIADATPVIVTAGIEQDFKITPAQLEAAITRHTRLFVLNSPSNPSGCVYTRAELAALGEVLRKHPGILIATDDMYEHILWTGEPFCNIVNACPDLAERTIVLNGVSKAYAMTGWRIGYAAGPKPLIGARDEEGPVAKHLQPHLDRPGRGRGGAERRSVLHRAHGARVPGATRPRGRAPEPAGRRTRDPVAWNVLHAPLVRNGNLPL